MQYYEAEVVSEYIIKGNAAIIKCNIPSFVTDFVKVEAWTGSDGSEYRLNETLEGKNSITEFLRQNLFPKFLILPLFL